MAKINRVEDLPEWFDLEKYRGVESFVAADWFRCLLIRQQILRAADVFGTGTQFSFADLITKTKEGAQELAELRRTPLSRDACNAYFWLAEHYDHDLPASPVRDLSMWDLAHQFQCDRDDVSVGDAPPFAVERWHLIATDELFTAPELDDQPVGDILDLGAPLLVDLRVKDSVLIGAFAAWLKNARTKRLTNCERERPDYKSWVRYGLLPYLDLLIWSKETGNDITHHVMAQAVGYCKGGDSFRRTVPSLAEKLLRSLAELEALAAIEPTPEKLGA